MVLLSNVGEPFSCKRFSRKETRWHFLRRQILLCTFNVRVADIPQRQPPMVGVDSLARSN